MQSKERYFIPPNQSIIIIPTDIQHLYICGLNDYEYDNLLFSFEWFYQLKSITIGNGCFKNVREFVLDDLESLKSVKISANCFCYNTDDGICRIMNCPNLTQLEIGYRSFRDFKSFELSNLNSLQSIKFGWNCFHYADFSLKGE